MKRQRYSCLGFLSLFAILVLIGVFTAGDVLAAGKPVVIRFGSIYAAGTPTGKAALHLEKLIEEKTNGEIDFQIFPSEQLGTEEEMVQSVSIGALEMTIPGTGIAGRFQREYLIFPLVFTFDDWDHLARVVDGPIGKDIAAKFHKTTGARVLASNWFREPRFLYGTRPIRKLEDLSGFRMRVPENPIWIQGWKRLGATPIPIALKEIYTSIQQGAIHGCETTISYCYSVGIHRIAKNVMLSRHALETNLCIINDKFFKKLSPKHQKALEEAAFEAGQYHQELVKGGIDGVLKKMEAEGSTLVEIDRDRWIKKVEGLGKELEKLYGPNLYERIRALSKKK